jgi:hypothetical protein
MPQTTTNWKGQTEALLNELAEATCRLARRHGNKGAFIDIELDLWNARQPLTQDASPQAPQFATAL